MFKKIYVPVDNSEHSNRAIELAVEIGRKFGATLVGSHVFAARLHDYHFKQMEYTLPEEYLEEAELERQQQIHNSLIALGLKLISDSYLDVMERRCQEVGLTFERKTFDGKHYKVLIEDIQGSDYDLAVIGALGMGAVKESLIGSVCERVVRRIATDTLVVKSLAPLHSGGGAILVGIDGSPQSFAGLKVALSLGKAMGRRVEAVAVYDPYFHYSVFGGIVRVLSEQAAKVFRFKEQEKLHEEIIDTGLAKIYQSHLDIARKMAAEDGVDLKITLLDGKAFERILHYVRKTEPWLLIIGRTGVHGEKDAVDLGSNAENLLRLAPCHVYLCGRKFSPPMDVRAEILHWTEGAKRKMERVPAHVRGMARTAVVQFAIEQGHTVITGGVIDQATERFMPTRAVQMVQEVAESVAIEKLRAEREATAICSVCGYVAKGRDPVKCPVCGAGSEKFQVIDREVIEAVASGEGGIEEEAFDGVRLYWTQEARQPLLRIQDAYLRRRAKARIEKAARVRKLNVITKEFVAPIIEETLGKQRSSH